MSFFISNPLLLLALSRHEYSDTNTLSRHGIRVKQFLDRRHSFRDKSDMAGHDGYTRYTVRIPDALYGRVKEAAGEKSVNAEIVAALEVMYPPKSIDVDTLADFLEAASAWEGHEEQKEFVETVNRLMAQTGRSWTMKPGTLGEVIFLPFKTQQKTD